MKIPTKWKQVNTFDDYLFRLVKVTCSLFEKKEVKLMREKYLFVFIKNNVSINNSINFEKNDNFNTKLVP